MHVCCPMLAAWLCCLVCGSVIAGEPRRNPHFHPDEIPAAPRSAAGGSERTQRTGEDWPEFLGPRGTGVSGESGLLDTWPADGPPVLWKKKIGEGYAAPSIRSNRLVLFHRPHSARGVSGPDEVIECLTADTGELLWRFAYRTNFSDPYGYNGGPRCTPLLTEDRCYAFGAQGMLTCLELESGKKVWQRDTEAEFSVPPAFFGVGATPILEGNLLIVMVGGHPRSGVVAFHATTGETVWENVGPEDFPEAPVRLSRRDRPAKLASYSTPLAATIHDRRVLLCLMRPGLAGLDPATGELRFAHWFRSAEHDSVNAARPVVVGDRVFLSAAYETGAELLEVRRDGQGVRSLWADVDAMQNHWSTCIHHHGHLYGFSGRHEPGSTMRCIDLETGQLRWQTEDDNAHDEPDRKAGLGRTPPRYYGRGSAILADGNLIVQGERGVLALVELNPEEFRELSRVKFPELGYPSWTAPVLSRGRLYLSGCRTGVSTDGYRVEQYHLLCLDLAAP